MYAAIDALADKLDRQVVKHKEKRNGHRHPPRAETPAVAAPAWWHGADRSGPAHQRALRGNDAQRRRRQCETRQHEWPARVDAAQLHRQVRPDGAGQTQPEQRQPHEPRLLGSRGMPADQRQRRRAQRRRADRPDDGDAQKHERRRLRRNERHCEKRGTRQQRHREHDVPEPPDDARDAVAGHTHRIVGQHEDQLVEHQDPDHPLPGNARLRGELRQVDHVDRPAQRKEELHDAEVEADHGRQAYGRAGLGALSFRRCPLVRAARSQGGVKFPTGGDGDSFRTSPRAPGLSRDQGQQIR